MNRRSFLTGALGVAVATPAAATAQSGSTMLRSTLNAAELGVSARKSADQSRGIQQLLNIASDDNREVFLPAGTYIVSQIKLPTRVRLSGVPGSTRLVFGRGTHMFAGERCELVQFSDLIIDGAGVALADHVPGIIHLAESRGISIDNCVVDGSSRAGIALDRSAGSICRTTVRNSADAGIRAVESTAMSITDNTVEDCGNGGIAVQRWSEGEDGTIVTGNRIARIGSRDISDGPNGSGIHIFRARGVIAANNRIVDCATSAIRAVGANNVQITGNNCSRAGIAGIASEAGFEGAMIASNIVDGAATGIAVTNFKQGGRMAVVSGNILRNIAGKGGSETTGVGIAVEADATVSGNVIEGAPRFGMRIGWGPALRDVAATGNVIRQSPVGIAVSVVEGVGSAVISDNLITGAVRGAVVGMRWGEAASGDLALSGAATFPHLLVERNRTG